MVMSADADLMRLHLLLLLPLLRAILPRLRFFLPPHAATTR